MLIGSVSIDDYHGIFFQMLRFFSSIREHLMTDGTLHGKGIEMRRAVFQRSLWNLGWGEGHLAVRW